jgi:hypothetical protein
MSGNDIRGFTLAHFVAITLGSSLVTFVLLSALLPR